MSVFALFRDEGDCSSKEIELIGIFSNKDDARLKAWYEYVVDFISQRNYLHFYIQHWSIHNMSTKTELLEEINTNHEYPSMDKIGGDAYPEILLEYTEEKKCLQSKKDMEDQKVIEEKRHIARRDLDRKLRLGEITVEEYFVEIDKSQKPL